MSLLARLKGRRGNSAPPPPSAHIAHPLKRLRESSVNDVEQGYGGFAEIQRICELPVVSDLTSDEVDDMSRELLHAKEFKEGMRLFHTQANAIHRYRKCRGGFFPVGVGWGKTGISLMVANIAYNRKEDPCKVIALFIPPDVVRQLVGEDIPDWRVKAKIQFPLHVMAGRSSKARMSMAKRRRPGLYVIAYSQLSTEDTDDMLDLLRPDLYIADEGHNLLDRKSARSNRMYKHFALHRPELVVMSGTMTNKSMMEYYKLSRFALHENNFMPNTFTLADKWSTFLDAEATKGGDYEISPRIIGPIAPLLAWAERHTGEKFETSPSGFRKAYQARMVSSPGCYSSGDAKIDCELVICQIRMDPAEYAEYPGWKKLMELRDKVRNKHETPNGDVIEHAFHEFKWLSEICGAGFYNELKWSTGDRLAAQRGISEDEALDLLDRALAHHEARNDYASVLRGFLDRRAIKGCDTPMLVGREFHMHGISNLTREGELYRAWRDMKDLDFDNRPERESEAIFICDFKIVQALQWACELPRGEGGIVWCMNKAVANWMYSYLQDAGVDSVHCPAGPPYDSIIKDKGNAHRVVVASIGGHSTGKNLQHFKHQMCLQWPRTAKTAEQMLGRLHRNGQKAKRIVAHLLACDDWDYFNFAATLNDALYIHQTMGNRQKLIYANYEPLPPIFPGHVLKERGADNLLGLSKENKDTLKAKFGGYSKSPSTTKQRK